MLSKNQTSKSTDNNPPLKKTIFSMVSMQIAFFSDLFSSGSIHPIEQKFHFADPAEESTLSRKHKWNQETQHIPQD